MRRSPEVGGGLGLVQGTHLAPLELAHCGTDRSCTPFKVREVARASGLSVSTVSGFFRGKGASIHRIPDDDDACDRGAFGSSAVRVQARRKVMDFGWWCCGHCCKPRMVTIAT